MDLAVPLLIWLGVVVVSMLFVSYFAVRWGHDPFGWALLSTVFGPIAVIALIGTRQSDADRSRPFERVSGGKPSGASSCVVVASDGSPASERIARYVVTAHPAATDVVLFVVLPAGMRSRSGPQQEREYEAQVEAMTSAPEKILRDAGIPVRVVIGYGQPGEEIVRLAAEERADVVVVGRRGAGLTKALLGSVSDAVVKHAKQPVVVVD